MDGSTGLAVWVALLAAAGLAAFAAYRWRCRRRARLVGAWVRAYLQPRYGGVPRGLHISCTDDPSWPVLVDFEEPGAGARRRLQFYCPGADPASYRLDEAKSCPEADRDGTGTARQA